VAAPRAWIIEDVESMERAAKEAAYPCVLKPLEAHYWRQGGNWELVGARKAIAVGGAADLRSEYRAIARADHRALLQEMVPGSDDNLVTAACYIDAHSRCLGGFQTRKLLQVPEGFGTGCIVQSVALPELMEPTVRLLQAMDYRGIAEVEYKFDSEAGAYKLIEVNPRPWDQHRLGNAAGVDLVYAAWCEHAGLPAPAGTQPVPGAKWIAEDTLATALVRSLRHGTARFAALLQLARGKRIYAIGSWKDPLPSLLYWTTRYLPDLAGGCARSLWTALRNRLLAQANSPGKRVVYDTHAEKP
jgi:predicted ATP-grasp superfamily ATP-dependent carboligase